MAGRWVMASIQTSFSVMPAAVYWLGGTVLSHSISIATIVAFTTLQARLFFPVGSLLGVGLDIQTSLALFDRIFEYLDAPVDIAERENPVEVAAGGRRRLRPRLVQVRRRGLDAAGRELRRPRRDDDRARRRDRRRQDDARLPRSAALRRRPGLRLDRRRRRPRPQLRRAGEPRRRRLAGDVPLPRLGAREPALREARRDGRGARTRPPRRRGSTT